MPARNTQSKPNERQTPDQAADNLCVGRVFDVQRFAVHDGPGIRTTVYLKGCPLRCTWCQNPESISPQPQLLLSHAQCTLCGTCQATCPAKAHSFRGGVHMLDRQRCALCRACVTACPNGAIEVAGRQATVAELLQEVQRDRAFYEESGGGLTISGGEPLMQPDFAEAIAREARRRGLHVCLDTSGHAPWPILHRMLSTVDLFLYDVKLLDDDLHRRHTGVGNSLILDNLRRLVSAGAAVVLRCPVVPTINDTKAHFDLLAGLARELGPDIECVILPYHRLARSKYDRLGQPYALADLSDMKRGQAQSWVDYLRKGGVKATL